MNLLMNEVNEAFLMILIDIHPHDEVDPHP